VKEIAIVSAHRFDVWKRSRFPVVALLVALSMRVYAQTTSTPDPIAEGDELTKKAIAAYLRKDVEQALKLTDRVVELFTSAGDGRRLRDALTDRGMLRAGTGDIAGSIADLENVEASVPANERGGKNLTNLKWLSDIYVLLGRYDLADDRLRRARELARNIGEWEKEFSLSQELAVLDLMSGHYAEALALLLDSQKLMEEAKLDTTKTRSRIATAYALLGDYRAALGLLNEVRSHAREENEPLLEADMLEQIAAVHARERRYAEAILDQRQALALRVLHDRQLHTQVDSLRQLAEYSVGKGDIGLAVLSLEHAAALEKTMVAAGVTGRPAEEVPLSDLIRLSPEQQKAFQARAEAADRRRNLGREGLTYLQLNMPERAKTSFAGALAEARKAAELPSQVSYLGGLADAEARLGHPDVALSRLEEAMEIAERVRRAAAADFLQASTQSAAFDVFAAAVDLLYDAHRAEDAFRISERSRARAFLDRISGVHPTSGNAEVRKLLDEEAVLARQRQQLEVVAATAGVQPASNDEAKTAAEIETVERKRQALLAQIDVLDATAATWLGIDPPSLEKVEKAIPADTTLISYFLTNRNAFAFVVTSGKLIVRKLPRSSDGIAEWMEEFHSPGTSVARRRALLEDLGAALIEPLAKDIEGRRILVVPHSILHVVPFGALRTSALAGRTIHRLPSASSVTFLAERKAPSETHLLAISAANVRGRPVLLHAREEVESIAALYGRSATVLAEGEGVAVEEGTPKATIIHLAAHGESRLDAPSLSSIVLVEANGNASPLEARDILQMTLPRSPLVVLSACETMLAPGNHSDDSLGLVDAFLLAGAGAVVASLWRVDDAATRDLMVAFHREMIRGLSPAKALQKAREETAKRYPDPLSWAAFEISGGI
jgi:CHAT domain-containing protein